MNPIEAVFWWGFVAGGCGTIITGCLLVLARVLVFGKTGQDFTGEHHDGRP